MWLMLQQDKPDDYVIATGETYSVRELCEYAFGCLNLDYKKYVQYNPRYERPAEVDLLIGDPTKAKAILGWKPNYTFKSLIQEMVMHDYTIALLESKEVSNKS
jgi:GDPmannose 4,6-dehydratase